MDIYFNDIKIEPIDELDLHVICRDEKIIKGKIAKDRIIKLENFNSNDGYYKIIDINDLGNKTELLLILSCFHFIHFNSLLISLSDEFFVIDYQSIDIHFVYFVFRLIYF